VVCSLRISGRCALQSGECLSDLIRRGAGSRTSARRLSWFLALEAVFVAAAAVALWQGADRLSLVFLLAPLQLGALAVLLESDFRLLAYFVALLPLTALELIPYTYMNLVMYGGVLGLAVFVRATAFVSVEKGSTASRQATWHHLPLVLFGASVGAAYLSARAHGWLSSYVSYYSLLSIQVIVLVWLVASVPRSIDELRQLIYVASAGYALVCVAFPIVLSRVALGSVGKTFMVGNAAVNMNAVGAHAAAFAVVATGAALDTRRTAIRALLLVAAFLLVILLVLTKSRGAWLGFGLAFVYMIARTRSYRLILPAAAVLGLLLSMDVLHGALTSRVAATSPDDPSLLGRLVLWRYALLVFKDNWLFGVGMENFRFVKHLFGFPLSLSSGVRFNSHNLLLELLADLGVVGTFSFCWLLGRSFARADRVARRSSSGGRRWLAVGLSAGLITFVGQGLFDCIIWQHGAFMVLGLLIGMCLCLARLELPQPSGHDSASPVGTAG
jgi:O-antigen ligase